MPRPSFLPLLPPSHPLPQESEILHTHTFLFHFKLNCVGSGEADSLPSPFNRLPQGRQPSEFCTFIIETEYQRQSLSRISVCGFFLPQRRNIISDSAAACASWCFACQRMETRPNFIQYSVASFVSETEQINTDKNYLTEQRLDEGAGEWCVARIHGTWRQDEHLIS